MTFIIIIIISSSSSSSGSSTSSSSSTISSSIQERITSESRTARLTPWIRAVLEKLRLVKKFLAICGTQWFINVYDINLLAPELFF